MSHTIESGSTPNLLLEIVDHDGEVVHGERVEEVIATAEDGQIGFLPGHLPCLALLAAGVSSYRPLEGQQRYLAHGTGFLEVDPLHVTILADWAEKGEELDVHETEITLEQATRALSEAGADDDRAELEQAKERAEMRDRAARLAAEGKALSTT